MINKFQKITNYNQLNTLNNQLHELWMWVSRADYEEVTDATSEPSGGTHKDIKILSDGTNVRLWINVESTWYNVGDLISTVPDHDHSGDSGDGGTLDWDDIWSDAVHDHSAAGEGGQLDWDTCFSDAVHSHVGDSEGGYLDHGNIQGLGDDDHSIYLLADGTRNLTGNLNVSGSVTIDGRDLSVDGTKLDGIESSATADQTETEIKAFSLDKIVCNDNQVICSNNEVIYI